MRMVSVEYNWTSIKNQQIPHKTIEVPYKYSISHFNYTSILRYNKLLT